MTRDERRLFVQLSKLHGFVEVDLASDRHRSARRPARRDRPRHQRDALAQHTVNHGLNITSDDRLLFAAGSAGDYLCVYELPKLNQVAQIPTGKEPNWIVFSKDEALAFVSNRADDTISFVSVRDLVEVARVPAGDYPQRMTTVLRDQLHAALNRWPQGRGHVTAPCHTRALDTVWHPARRPAEGYSRTVLA